MYTVNSEIFVLFYYQDYCKNGKDWSIDKVKTNILHIDNIICPPDFLKSQYLGLLSKNENSKYSHDSIISEYTVGKILTAAFYFDYFIHELNNLNSVEHYSFHIYPVYNLKQWVLF